MNDNTKKIKVEFAPGCFDDFDGSQQELDDLMSMLTTMTPEELAARSRPVDFNSLDQDLVEKILGRLDNDSRKLQ
jgi:hypothetical protein